MSPTLGLPLLEVAEDRGNSGVDCFRPDPTRFDLRRRGMERTSSCGRGRRLSPDGWVGRWVDGCEDVRMCGCIVRKGERGGRERREEA